MKKIGILFGKEDTFPQAFIDRVNSKGLKDIVAEAVSIDMVQQAAPTEYAVIIDRISQDVPYYRAYLKNAAISGTAVINNPFWWSADEKFFNNALAEKVGVPVPKTVIIPSHERPDDTGEMSFRNLKLPYGWEKNFEYVGFPAYMKPHDGGGWKSVYRVENPDDLWAKHSETGQLVMMLQEEIEFTEYFRCYALGGDNIHIMQYEPRNPHHERYVLDGPPVAKSILDKVRKYSILLNRALGYDFNTIEFAIRDGIPYAIDFCNPAPDADINSVGEDNFEWIVENAAQLAIRKAKAHKDGQMNLTWGTFVKDQLAAPAVKKAAPKRAPRKTTTSTTKAASARSAKATSTKTTRPKATSTGNRSKANAAAKPATAKASPVKRTANKAVKPATKEVATKAATKPIVKKTAPVKSSVSKAVSPKTSTAKKATTTARRKTTATKTVTKKVATKAAAKPVVKKTAPAKSSTAKATSSKASTAKKATVTAKRKTTASKTATKPEASTKK